MAHLRAAILYALPNFPQESISMLRLIADLYEIERDTSGSRRPKDCLQEKRKVSPFKGNGSALRAMNPPPRSALGKAIAYALKH